VRSLRIPLGLLLVVAAGGCARDSLEAVRKEQVQTVKEAVELLQTVRDRDSADKARPRLKQLGERWRDLAKRRDALKAVSADEEALVKGKYGEEMGGLILRYAGDAVRVALVPGGAEALKEIGDVKAPR
jgi:hypothetical protein